MPAALTMPRTLSLGAWLRVAARILAMVLLLLACIPLYYVHRLLGLPNPWPRMFLSGVTRIAGIAVSVEGVRPVGSCFLIANHVSWIDIPVIARITGSAFVGHDGLAAMPVLKWLCQMNDTVFIARHDRASVADQIAQVRHAMDDMHALTIFPEGTTSDGTGLLPFKSALLSAFEPLPPGVTIQPVLLDYSPEAARVAWVGEEHGLDNFLRILARRRPVRIKVCFLAPLTGDELINRKTIAHGARAAIARRMQGA